MVFYLCSRITGIAVNRSVLLVAFMRLGFIQIQKAQTFSLCASLELLT